MTKELRALERIKEFLKVNAKHWKQDTDMIEKALKVKEGKRWQEPKKSELIVENEHLRIILSALLNSFLGTPQAFYKVYSYHICKYEKSEIYQITIVCKNHDATIEKRISCTLTEDMYLYLSKKVHPWQE